MRGDHLNSKEISIIMAYINKNCHRNIGLKEIANFVNYSEFYLSRCFKKATDYTIRQNTESVRVEKGIESLVGTDESVTDVSLDTGHKSLGTFSNTFKRQTGVSLLKSSTQIAHDL